MKYNIGKTDLIIRVILSVSIAILYFLNIFKGTIANIALPISVILFFTATRGCCPLYAIFGFGTCGSGVKSKTPIIKVKKVKF